MSVLNSPTTKYQTTEQNAAHPGGGITRRVVVLSILLAVLFGYIIPYIDAYFSDTFLGAAHLPPGAIGALLILFLVVNPLLKVLSGRLAFHRNELLTIYSTCLFSCLIPGHGSETFFVPTLVAPFYFASPENKWMGFMQPYLKPWLTPALTADGHVNTKLVDGWFLGAAHIPWAAWIIPLLAWTAMILASYIMLGCLSIMLRAQWAEREALAFPLLKLPIAMTEDTGGAPGFAGRLFANKVMWIGFFIAVFIELLNGLNRYFPDIPTMPLQITGSFFTENPWNQLGLYFPKIWIVVVGITYLLTGEVSFSLWFFFLFIKFQLLLAYYCGLQPGSLPKMLGQTGGAHLFTGFQQFGAYIGFAGLTLWSAREHLMHITRRAFGRVRATSGESAEALSYPAAFWGFVLALFFLIGWSVAAGIAPLVAIVLWILYLVLAITLTRIVIECGLLFVQQGWTSTNTIAMLGGSGPGTWLSAASIVPANMLQLSMFTDLRAFLMPSFVQSLKLASDRKIEMRKMLALISVVILIGLGMGIWMNVRLGYEYGGLQLNSWFAQSGAQLPASYSSTLIHATQPVGWGNWFWLGIGVAETIAITAARNYFLWFPLHPIGLLMCLTYPMNQMWFSIFLGWLAKTLISRFGGNESYQKLIPFFLGLILGDVAMMLFWLAINVYTGVMKYNLMPA
jgi:hypothetical protein